MNIGVFGGTGTIGYQLAEHFKNETLFVFSRDEYKQATMKKTYPNIHFQLGDVRNYRSVLQFMRQSFDYVIFAAAMKRVEMCEQFPDEAVKTNINGIENVLEAAEVYPPINLVSIGTDKDVEPVNVYGMTKAVQERLVTSSGWTVVRYGNVWGSRGSVVEVFAEQAKTNTPLTITNPAMTRFILTKSEAVSLVEYGMLKPPSGDIFVKKSNAASIIDIAKVFSDSYCIIGPGKGEKVHEVLVSSEEAARTKYEDGYYIIGGNTVPIEKICVSRYSSDIAPKYSTEDLRSIL